MAMTEKEKQGAGDLLRASFTSAIDDYTREYSGDDNGGIDVPIAAGYLMGIIYTVRNLAQCLDSTQDSFFRDLYEDFYRQFEAVLSREGGGADA